jgi:cytochrome c-type biogenesis protein CcmH/NrfG
MADRPAKERELTPREAINMFERAAKENPNDAQAQFNLGSAYYVAANLDAAFDAFQNAVRLSPGLNHVHYYLGVIFATRGDKAKAREELEKVVNGNGHVMLKNQARIQLNAL